MKTKRRGSSFNSLNSKRQLESIFLFTTGKCNAKCAMCFYANDMEKKAEDLSFAEIRKISETAGNFKRLWLSGGEPTLREDLPEIVEMFYRNNHITDLNFPTNGIMGDRIIDWLSRIRKTCPDCNISISISLDGFGSTHDTQRGVASFYRAAETLRKIDDHFRDDGHVIKNIATVITKYNVEEILDFVTWVYGRFNVSTHTIEAARGVTREDGVKVLTENSLRKIQDHIAPYYLLYARRIGEGMNFIGRGLTKFFYVGLMRTMYNIRAANLEKPTCWNMDCTAGETTLVVDYDGRFRACELREPVGNVKDYGCDVQKIMSGEAMKKEIDAIGHGYRANCWCTHGCWIMSSITFNPGKMISLLMKSNRETKKLSGRSMTVNEELLRSLEDKYHVDRAKLEELGIVGTPGNGVSKGAA
ncbi:MAG: radical SAM protein [Treponema sp.]|jgi:MoaA/NifB/PqqE/SkfB family radical SAM enzyme|nr:radical SAM protein [Treponema sp.]